MIIWLAIFLIIIIVSFILAYNSMRDFVEVPLSESKSIFLIRNISALNYELILNLHQKLLKDSETFSIERIFKGGKIAYILVGPKFLPTELPELNLLELEDYVHESNNLILWEIVGKDKIKFHLNTNEQLLNFSQSFPPLKDQEEFWFQLLIKPEKGKLWSKLGDKKTLQAELSEAAVKEYAQEKDKKVLFTGSIRVGLLADDARLKELGSALSNLAEGNLIKLPRPLGTSEMLNLYKNRIFYKAEKAPLFLTGDEVISLLLN